MSLTAKPLYALLFSSMIISFLSAVTISPPSSSVWRGDRRARY
jgi:hypothetical protein